MKKLTFLFCTLVCAGALSAQTYYITGSSATLFGASWDPAKMALDEQPDGTYAKTFTTCVIDKEYQFKITNGDWDNDNGGKTWGFSDLTSVPEGVTGVTEGTGKNNIVCTTYDANMTVVFDPVAGKITLTGVFKGTPKPLSYFALHGNFTGGWKDTDNFTISDDASTATLSMTLAAGSYEFGARIGSSDNWSSSGETITRASNSADFTKSGGNNKLTADVAGTYTFTYTVATKVLVVTYPEATGGEGGEGGESGGSASDYYLVGYINGADYGCEADAANLGKYKFVDGKLTATFTAKSYVFVKTGDNNNWYMSETYVEPAESATATLKSANESIKEKLGVPGNVEVHFTLTVNGDGTLTLAYTTDGEGGGNTDPDPEPDPEPGRIVIKVQIPDDLTAWDYTVEPYVYSWATGAEGKFAAQPMSLVDGWYTHTFDVAVANFIIVNGNDWPEGTSRQSVNMENVTADACYIMGNGEEIKDDDGSSWKKTLTATECEATALQAVTVANIYANNGRIYGAEGMRIYTVSGMDVTDQNGQLNGIYIVKAQTGVYKIAVK